MSSENFVCDVSVNVGADRTENSWFKFKLGKGQQEIMALKQEVQTGSGQKLHDNEHCVCIWFPSDAETESVTDMVEGMMPGENAVNVVDDANGNGKWVIMSLNKAAGDGEEADMMKAVDAQLEEFFSQTENNAYVEFAIKTATKCSDMLEIAQAAKEKEMDPSADHDNYPSFMTFFENMQVMFRADMDHQFLITVLQWAQKFGVATTSEFFDFIKKFNHLSMKVNMNDHRHVGYNTEKAWIKAVWEGLGNTKEMFAELEAFKSMCNQMRLIFIVKDSAYLNIDMNMLGMGDYMDYWIE